MSLRMPRRVRFVPEGGALVEVTVRTDQSRMLLRPSSALNEVVLGVLGRAQRRYEVGCCGVVFMSNHWHALLQVDDALQLSRFMQYCNSNWRGRWTGWWTGRTGSGRGGIRRS